MAYDSKEKKAEYQNKHYKKNKEYYKQKRQDRREVLIDEYSRLKSTFVCSICSESDPATIDLHHLDKDSKESIVSILVQHGTSWYKIVAEIEKCVSLCANCHRKVHAYKEWAAKIGPEHLIIVPDEYRTVVIKSGKKFLSP